MTEKHQAQIDAKVERSKRMGKKMAQMYEQDAMREVFKEMKYSLMKDHMEHMLLDTNAAARAMQDKLDASEAIQQELKDANTKLKWSLQEQKDIHELLVNRTKTMGGQILRRYSYEKLTDDELTLRGWGNWMFARPYLKMEVLESIIEVKKKDILALEKKIEILEELTRDFKKKEAMLKKYCMERITSSCVRHIVAVISLRCRLKKEFMRILDSTNEQHRLVLEKKNERINNLEKNIKEDATLNNLRNEVSELRWELDVAPGCPPAKVVVTDPKRVCTQCKRQVLYQEVIQQQRVDILPIKDLPGGFYRFQNVKPTMPKVMGELKNSPLEVERRLAKGTLFNNVNAAGIPAGMPGSHNTTLYATTLATTGGGGASSSGFHSGSKNTTFYRSAGNNMAPDSRPGMSTRHRGMSNTLTDGLTGHGGFPPSPDKVPLGNVNKTFTSGFSGTFSDKSPSGKKKHLKALKNSAQKHPEMGSFFGAAYTKRDPMGLHYLFLDYRHSA